MTAEKNKIKASGPGELAKLYGVNIRTFKGWIKPFKNEIGERQGIIYTVKQVKIIFEKIGEP